MVNSDFVLPGFCLKTVRLPVILQTFLKESNDGKGELEKLPQFHILEGRTTANICTRILVIEIIPGSFLYRIV